jgi:hypothetical protein
MNMHVTVYPRARSCVSTCTRQCIHVHKTVYPFAWGNPSSGMIQSICSRHDFPYIRGWMQMVTSTKWFIFLKQFAVQCTITLTLCITASWSRGETVSRVCGHAAMSLLLHCPEPTVVLRLFLGGRAPAPKVASLFPGSMHTPFLPSVTVSTCKSPCIHMDEVMYPCAWCTRGFFLSHTQWHLSRCKRTHIQ